MKHTYKQILPMTIISWSLSSIHAANLWALWELEELGLNR